MMKREMDLKLLRAMMITKRDAINLCEQVANITSNEKLKSALKEISKQEENHFEQLRTLLKELDGGQES